MTTATVLVVGLGDLGARVLEALVQLPAIGRLVGASRDDERGRTYAAQAALVAQLSGGAATVGFERLDLEDRPATVALLRRLDPHLIVMAASQHTWWRFPAEVAPERAAQLAALPYGAWLPLHLSLVRRLMEARREAGVRGWVVSLPFPDAVGPVLAPLGLAPQLGAGNVTEVAAKLAVLAAADEGASRDEVTVRLVMHHAAERVAFGAFVSLAGAQSPAQDEPPWMGEIHVGGRELTGQRISAYFHAPYPLPPGTATHRLTAAATAHLVGALLSDRPVRTHAPAPFGLPGGYPVLVSSHGLELDLPPEIGEQQAIEVNSRAARWDGLERIEPDGTVVFTSDVAEAAEAILGMRLQRVAPGEQDLAADEMLRRVAGSDSC